MLQRQINFSTSLPAVLKFSRQMWPKLLKRLRCAHISRIALIVLILFLLLEQVLFLHLEVSQGEGHNRWLNGYRLLLSVMSQYNQCFCVVI
jgi:hypothetical protein